MAPGANNPYFEFRCVFFEAMPDTLNSRNPVGPVIVSLAFCLCLSSSVEIFQKLSATPKTSPSAQPTFSSLVNCPATSSPSLCWHYFLTKEKFRWTCWFSWSATWSYPCDLCNRPCVSVRRSIFNDATQQDTHSPSEELKLPLLKRLW